MNRRHPTTSGQGIPRIELAVRARSVRLDLAHLRRVLVRLLEDHDTRGVLSLAIVGDDEIRRIHRDFLGDDTPTDVISFLLSADPLDPNAPGIIGEVIVSADTARREARRRRLPAATELAWYAIHGTLHLVGYDDLEPARKRVMRRRERKYLGQFTAGVKVPGAVRPRRPTRRPRGPAARRPRSTDT